MWLGIASVLLASLFGKNTAKMNTHICMTHYCMFTGVGRAQLKLQDDFEEDTLLSRNW